MFTVRIQKTYRSSTCAPDAHCLRAPKENRENAYTYTHACKAWATLQLPLSRRAESMCRCMRIPWRECTCLCVRVTGAAEWRIDHIHVPSAEAGAVLIYRCVSSACPAGVTREGSRSITRTLEDLVTTYETEAIRQVHEFICRTSLITPRTKANEKKLKRARTHTWAALLHSHFSVTLGLNLMLLLLPTGVPTAGSSSELEPVSCSEPSAAAHPEARPSTRARPASEPLARAPEP